jgi:hypothetical protein
MTKCAFMNKECDGDCAAYVGNVDGFHFPCERLDAMYEIAWSLKDIRERGIFGNLGIESRC